jgi:hypothetical protein
MKESYGVQCTPREIVQHDSEYSVGSWAAGTIKKTTKQVPESSEKIELAPKPIGKCAHCADPIYEITPVENVKHYGPVIASHIDNTLFMTDEEGELWCIADMVWIGKKGDEGFYVHKASPHGVCRNCEVAHDLSYNKHAFFAIGDEKYAKCIYCAETKICAVSGLSRLVEEMRKVDAMNPVTGLMQEYYIGEEHFSSMTLCLCKLLVPFDNTNELLSNRGRVCAQCVQHTPSGPRYEPGISVLTNTQKKAQAKVVS